MKRAKRALLWIGLAVVLLLVGTVVAGWAVLRASLPRTGGHTVVPGMTAPVEVSRDALGIPTIEGASTLDVARGQGFVHAQDRYFQMDLTRRFAAGELTPPAAYRAGIRHGAPRIRRVRAGIGRGNH